MCVAGRSEGTTSFDRAWEPQLPVSQHDPLQRKATSSTTLSVCTHLLVDKYCHLNLFSLQYFGFLGQWHANGPICPTGQREWCELYVASQNCRVTNQKSNKLSETLNFQWVEANSIIKGIPEGANRANGQGIETITWKHQRETRILTR